MNGYENVKELFLALSAKYGKEATITAITAEMHGTIEFTVDGKEDSITIDELMGTE